ncbi:restriction endonuclease subunit S [Micromonospora humida]|uniref:restriction endonuclease subunit S n=1 Tax=Micromonospora humida TaxID=2809018 RepID=UPI0033D0E060
MILSLDRSAWKRVSLGDVAAASKEKVDPESGQIQRYVAGEHMDSNDLKIHRWGEVGDGYLGPAFHRRFRPGQVLYGSRRAYLRKVAVAEFGGVTANTTFVVETKNSERLLQEFLPFVMTSETFHAFAAQESKGSVNPYLNWSDVVRYEFDLPPVSEQKRLADFLWAVERYRLSIKKRSAMEAASVSASLRSWWRLADKRAIGEIADCVTGSTPSRVNGSYWDSADVPFYTPSEIVGETMSPARQWVSMVGARAGRMLQANAVAVACIGGDMGKSAVIKDPGVSNQQITSIVGLSESDAYLLQAFLSHPDGRAAMEARETTTIVRKLNKSDLVKVEVPWPDDRKSLHGLVTSHRRCAEAAAGEVARLAVLRSALLADIFGDAK